MNSWHADFQAYWLTLQLAGVSTLILLLVGIPLAWWMANTRWRGKFLLDALIAMPLVLPPTVLGFYLLLLLGSQGPLAALFQSLNMAPLAFSFQGLVIGSVIYSLPFVVQPIQTAFSQLNPSYLEAAATLGASKSDRFLTIALPLARPGLLTGGILGFAHTLGEFGVVLMIGGNIPGETRVASIAIYEYVETLNYGSAHALSLTLLVSSFLLLVLTYAINRNTRVLGP